MADDSEGLRRRITRSGEDALGRLAQDLLENPLVHGAIARAFEAREKAAQAQEVAMGALNLPSAADIERLTRRVRSVSQRLEGIEDGVDRVGERLAALSESTAIDARLEAIEQQLAGLSAELGAIREALPEARKPVSRNQERLKVPPE
jgi:chromosome segregation ATPase